MSTPLQKIRKKLRVSQNEVCRETKINQGNYSRIERGIDTSTAKNAEKIAKFFGHRISELEIMYPERYTDKTVAPDIQP